MIKDGSIYCGDCLEIMKDMPSNYVDAVITDPPAGISFMEKEWDSDKGGRDNWIAWMEEIARECLRVIKPGGHCLVWAIPRTSHWTAMAWENAGFEIRDVVSHVFSTGFPKSVDISKAIEKRKGVEPLDVIPAYGGIASLPEKGWHNVNNAIIMPDAKTEEGRKYLGWGSALKPAREDWILMRKPLSEKTLIDNVLKWGTGGINVGACRHGSARRFPSNFMHDDSPDVLELFPVVEKDGGGKERAARYFYCTKPSTKERNLGCETMQDKYRDATDFRPSHRVKAEAGSNGTPYGRWGKTKNNHPTVKPVRLMRYLVRLITPKDGIVLDCFAGSGTTGIACAIEGKRYILIEKEEEYCEIARSRIKYWMGKKNKK